MKFEKWTMGLAAVGVVSLASAAQAQVTANPVISAVSDTTISGYVDASAQWNMGTGNANNPPYSYSGGKADGFNLNVVQLSVSKDLDETPWAAGYHVDLWLGPDAASLNTSSMIEDGSADFAIRQAYVQLRTPVGAGDLSWKLGVFDTLVGYESLSAANNPHYTHSYGFTMEPSTHTGLLGTYQANEFIGLSLGVANTVGPRINERAFGDGEGDSHYVGDKAESYKTYMGSLSLTAPQSMGWLAGSSLYGGFVNGFSSSYEDNQTSYYLGGTVATPVSGLKFGVSYDNLDNRNNGQDMWAAALYASMQATEKLTFLVRGEYFHLDGVNSIQPDPDVQPYGNTYALTLTAQYDLWANVLSRVEFRWDHAEHGQLFGSDDAGVPNRENAYMLAGNIIY